MTMQFSLVFMFKSLRVRADGLRFNLETIMNLHCTESVNGRMLVKIGRIQRKLLAMGQNVCIEISRGLPL